MGRSAQVLKAQRAADKRKHERHAVHRRSDGAPAKAPGRGKRTASAAVRPVRPFPTTEDQALLLTAPADAARLQPSSADLCRVLRALMPAARVARRDPEDDAQDAPGPSPTEAAAKKTRTESGAAADEVDGAIADGVSPRAVLDGLKDALPALLVDESGVHVVETLIRGGGHEGADDATPEARAVALEAVDSVMYAVNEAAVQQAEVAEDEAAAVAGAKKSRKGVTVVAVDDEAGDEGIELVNQPLAALGITTLFGLACHAVGRRIVWAMIEHGSKEQRKKLNRELAAECLNLVTDRHGVHTVLALLQHFPPSCKTIVPALQPQVAELLLPDPVGAKAAAALVAPESAVQLLEGLGADAITATTSNEALEYSLDGPAKRTVRFVIELLKKGLAKQPAEGADAVDADARRGAVVKLAKTLQPRLTVLAKHEAANFLVQALIRALASWGTGDKMVWTALEAAVKAFTSTSSAPLVDLARHPIASHVVGCVAGCAPTQVAAAIRPHLLQLASDKHGSIALRRMVENAAPAEKAQAVAAALLEAMGQHIPTFITDEHGNLVLQALLRGLKPADRTKFYDQHIRPSLLDLCKHRFAAHVVHSLVSGTGAPLDAAGLNKLFGALKQRLVELAQHVAGRFVVEAVVAPFREAQEILVAGLGTLVRAQGAQGVVLRVYECCDSAAKGRIAAFVRENLRALSSDKQGSLVIQKLLGRDHEVAATGGATPVRDAVRSALTADKALADSLRSDFFGRFVVQLAEGNAPRPQAPSAPAGGGQRPQGGASFGGRGRGAGAPAGGRGRGGPAGGRGGARGASRGRGRG